MDLAAHHPAGALRDERRKLVELMTPETTTWGTDLGAELTSLALQVHGGAAYIEETGVAEHVRDARIAPIYDPLGNIEALDRRLAAAGADFSAIGTYLPLVLCCARPPTGSLTPRRARPAGATPYRLFGIVVGGWLMARRALAAHALLPTAPADRAAFLDAKVVTARFYWSQLLPQAAGLLPAGTAGTSDLLELTSDQF